VLLKVRERLSAEDLLGNYYLGETLTVFSKQDLGLGKVLSIFLDRRKCKRGRKQEDKIINKGVVNINKKKEKAARAKFLLRYAPRCRN
jgi:hypothetical protein